MKRTNVDTTRKQEQLASPWKSTKKFSVVDIEGGIDNEGSIVKALEISKSPLMSLGVFWSVKQQMRTLTFSQHFCEQEKTKLDSMVRISHSTLQTSWKIKLKKLCEKSLRSQLWHQAVVKQTPGIRQRHTNCNRLNNCKTCGGQHHSPWNTTYKASGFWKQSTKSIICVVCSNSWTHNTNDDPYISIHKINRSFWSVNC